MDIIGICTIVLCCALFVVGVGMRYLPKSASDSHHQMAPPALIKRRKFGASRLSAVSCSVMVNGQEVDDDDEGNDGRTDDVSPLDSPSIQYRRRSFSVADELKTMDVTELRAHNHLNKKNTDRYWREIYRRNNSNKLPDTINLNDLTKQNAITVLDERLPRGAPHGTEEFSIVAGCDEGRGEGDATLQDHVIKYLKKRYPANEICADPGDGVIRILPMKS